MPSLPSWIARNLSHLRDLAFLVIIVGLSLALLIFVFGTRQHRPFRISASNSPAQVSTIGQAWAGFAAIVAKLEPVIIRDSRELKTVEDCGRRVAFVTAFRLSDVE